ncbi:MAG: HD domain-containing protein [Pseudomonadota bacterium]
MTATPDLNRETIVDFLGGIFERNAAEEYLGEPVTIAEHMLQGAQLADEAGAADEVVAAALLHDIGHFVHEFEADAADHGIDTKHEEAGAEVIERFFPSIVVDCVRYHVDAKRYLCATNPKYFDRLSEASIHSLNLQGGPMSKPEVDAFGANPNLKDILRVRVWDEEGKIAGKDVPGFRYYAPLLQRVVDQHLGA